MLQCLLFTSHLSVRGYNSTTYDHQSASLVCLWIRQEQVPMALLASLVHHDKGASKGEIVVVPQPHNKIATRETHAPGLRSYSDVGAYSTSPNERCK